MAKCCRLLLFLLLSFSAFAQNTVGLKGKVVDKIGKYPLEAATVYLSNSSDSTLVDYTITDKSGTFTLNAKKTTKPVFLRVSYTGYQDFKSVFTELSVDKDFGTIDLSESENLLGEVIVKSEAPPIRIKNDTLEFNASSFKVRPDANVETLLKQLPGVEIDADGKITVNGKEVNQILVNGKPFFDKDGKIAIQNLPSEIINKVQITDSKTKKEETTGAKASGNEASINLTIDEDKNKGLFGKFMLGGGTDDRYESSLLVNYFKDKRKISILGSSNNINSTGFSMNEIFDSMGGGRNNSVYTSDDGSFGINGMRFGGGKGITRTNLIGTNYADEWFKDFDANVSYFYTAAKSENVNRTKEQNLLPDGRFTTTANAKTIDDKYAHNFNTEFNYKIDSTATFTYVPKFVIANSQNTQSSDQVSTNERGEILNQSVSNMFDESDNKNFKSDLYFNKNFKKKNRGVNVSLSNDNSKNEMANKNISNTTFFEDANNDGIVETRRDDRNQKRANRNITDQYSVGFEYKEPIADSISMKLELDYNTKTNSQNRSTFDFDAARQQYSVLNDSLTNQMLTRTTSFSPLLGLNVAKSKLYVGITAGPQLARFDIRSQQLGKRFSQSRNYFLPSVNGYVNYKFTKSRNLYFNYGYEVEFPQVNQVAPIVDYYNPLNTSVGNPDLQPNRYHSVYAGFRDYDYSTKSGYYFYAGGQYYNVQDAPSTVYDASRKRTTTYVNISDTYYSWFGGSWNKSIKKEANTFKFGFGINAGLNKFKGFTNNVGYVANEFRLSPRVSFNYDYGELISINPSYTFTYREIKYTNYVVDRAGNYLHKFNIQTTTYWPKHVVFGNDFGYTYNSNIADGFKKDFYLWNTSLGYNFLKDRLLAKVKVYDMLNQNIATSRTITSTSIRDEENIVLRRYAMFSLTYKLEKFGGKKKSSNFFD